MRPGAQGPMKFDGNDFDGGFSRISDRIEKNAGKFAIAGVISWLFSGAVSLAVLCFAGWVVIKLMAHFGVL